MVQIESLNSHNDIDFIVNLLEPSGAHFRLNLKMDSIYEDRINMNDAFFSQLSSCF